VLNGGEARCPRGRVVPSDEMYAAIFDPATSVDFDFGGHESDDADGVITCEPFETPCREHRRERRRRHTRMDEIRDDDAWVARYDEMVDFDSETRGICQSCAPQQRYAGLTPREADRYLSDHVVEYLLRRCRAKRARAARQIAEQLNRDATMERALEEPDDLAAVQVAADDARPPPPVTVLIADTVARHAPPRASLDLRQLSLREAAPA
jgi:hypothetical protein